MGKRVMFALGLLGIAAMGVVALVHVNSPRPRINPDVFEELRLGMSRPQVEEALGAPAGYYARKSVTPLIVT